MYSVLKSYGLNGLNGFAVAVEADVSGGLPAFSLVGLPDSAVRESGDRVRSAVKNLGYKWPDRHIRTHSDFIYQIGGNKRNYCFHYCFAHDKHKRIVFWRD